MGIGIAPACPYGYFDYAPYACSPYGYYGPDWFNGGIFLGAGPWFHGPRGFTAMSITGSIRVVATTAPSRNVVNGRSTTFTATKGRDFQGRIGNPGHDAGGERNPEAHGAFRGGGGGHEGGGRR